MSYYPQLDALRAIAVFAVLVQHFYSKHIPWGFFGVRLFYVLSGFLITSIILTHKSRMQETGSSILKVARNFYVRRSLRLFPIYYLVLIFLVLTSLLYNRNVANVLDGWEWHFLYLTNIHMFSEGGWIGPLSHFWSLAVEEQFYIFWFCVVIFVKPRYLLPVALGLLIAAQLYRTVSYLLGYGHVANLLLFGCLDTLGMGCVLAIATHDSCREYTATIRGFFTRHLGVIRLAVAGCLVLLVYCAVDKEALSAQVLRDVLSAIVFAWVIYRAYAGYRGYAGRLLSNRCLIYVGRISYGIYVYHNLVPILYREVLASPVSRVLDSVPGLWRLQSEFRFLLLASITVLIAALSWKFIEAPINRKKANYSEGLGSAG